MVKVRITLTVSQKIYAQLCFAIVGLIMYFLAVWRGQKITLSPYEKSNILWEMLKLMQYLQPFSQNKKPQHLFQELRFLELLNKTFTFTQI